MINVDVDNVKPRRTIISKFRRAKNIVYMYDDLVTDTRIADIAKVFNYYKLCYVLSSSYIDYLEDNGID